MLKSILFGPSSLNSRKPPSSITQGKVWGTTFVTPGAIAFMAVLVSQLVELYIFLLFDIFQAIFLHSPDKEFASVGAKSSIPYQNWFGQFKQYLMANAHKQQIKELYMWWNGWVFSFEKAPNLVDYEGEESSGMDEAVECLSNFDSQVPTIDYGWQEEQLIERFNDLTMAVPQESNEPTLSSSRSDIDIPQLTTLPSNTTPGNTPGPSSAPTDNSVEQQFQPKPIEDVTSQLAHKIHRTRKGKEKAIAIVEADGQVSEVTIKRKQRGRPKKLAI
jgi:hypothetical protein